MWNVRQFTSGPNEGKFFILSIMGLPVLMEDDAEKIMLFDTAEAAIEHISELNKHLREMLDGLEK